MIVDEDGGDRSAIGRRRWSSELRPPSSATMEEAEERRCARLLYDFGPQRFSPAPLRGDGRSSRGRCTGASRKFRRGTKMSALRESPNRRVQAEKTTRQRRESRGRAPKRGTGTPLRSLAPN